MTELLQLLAVVVTCGLIGLALAALVIKRGR